MQLDDFGNVFHIVSLCCYGRLGWSRAQNKQVNLFKCKTIESPV